MEAQEDKKLIFLIYLQAFLLGISYVLAILQAIIILLYILIKGYKVSLTKKQKYGVYFLLLNSIIALYYRNFLGILINALLIFYFFVYSFYLNLTNKTRENIENIVLYTSVFVNIAHIIYYLITKERVGYFSYFNPNYYGSYLTFIAILSLTKAKKNIKYFLIFLVSMATIVATGSRFSLIAIILALLVYVFLNFKKIYTLILSTLILMYSIGVYKGIFPFIRTDSISQYLKLRMDIWYMGIKAIKTNVLLGHGTAYFYYFTNNVYAHTHNILIELILSYGLIGLLILIILYLYDLKLNRTKIVILTLIMVHGIADYTTLWYQTLVVYMIVFTSKEEKKIDG